MPSLTSATAPVKDAELVAQDAYSLQEEKEGLVI